MSISINEILNSLKRKITHGEKVFIKEKLFRFHLEAYKCTNFYIRRKKDHKLSIINKCKTIQSEEYSISNIYIYPFKLEELTQTIKRLRGIKFEGYSLSSNFNEMGIKKEGSNVYYAFKIRCDDYKSLQSLVDSLENAIRSGKLNDEHEPLISIEKLRFCKFV
ncbi:hypothetical protein G6162_004286 [Salmonella enterica]|nr:hypothetical protein [Salmonella enterica]EAV9187380.1 hypothetical protein [Salmonella enterica]EAX9064908.1 hypothetical protein [Salmonella enterica]EBM6079912.1 hypothetical protein [Salmonella enterica]EEA1371228.1 hypothetical protein [Salmonella enterica]